MLSKFKVLYLGQNGEHPLEISSARIQNSMALVKFKGIDTIEDARKLVDRTLFFDRADVPLPPGGYFIDDLLGAEIIDDGSGEVYGTLLDVTSNSAQDIYHIRMQDGSVRFLPAVTEFVINRDIPDRKIMVRPIPGMLD